MKTINKIHNFIATKREEKARRSARLEMLHEMKMFYQYNIEQVESQARNEMLSEFTELVEQLQKELDAEPGNFVPDEYRNNIHNMAIHTALSRIMSVLDSYNVNGVYPSREILDGALVEEIKTLLK